MLYPSEFAVLSTCFATFLARIYQMILTSFITTPIPHRHSLRCILVLFQRSLLSVFINIVSFLLLLITYMAIFSFSWFLQKQKRKLVITGYVPWDDFCFHCVKCNAQWCSCAFRVMPCCPCNYKPKDEKIKQSFKCIFFCFYTRSSLGVLRHDCRNNTCILQSLNILYSDQCHEDYWKCSLVLDISNHSIIYL